MFVFIFDFLGFDLVWVFFLWFKLIDFYKKFSFVVDYLLMWKGIIGLGFLLDYGVIKLELEL